MNFSLKQRYPFRLGTTSFIYPADYASNVRLLAPFVDEIELLLFESHHLPSKEEIDGLADLAETQHITYNVHLPMDIELAGVTAEIRRQSIDAVASAMDRVAPLRPTTQTLHLTFNRSDPNPNGVGQWQHLAVESLTELLMRSGIAPRRISLETLDYDPLWLKPVVEALDLSVCVDVGHVILYGFDLQQVLDSFAARTTILHLHGVAEGRDHLALTQMRLDHRNTISSFLRGFTGSVSIEVFNLKRLKASLSYFPDFLIDEEGRTAGPGRKF